MYINHALIEKILNAIFPLPEDFGMMEDEDYESRPCDYDYICSRLAKVDPEAIVSYGASKMVIYSPALENVVIKIPFNGQYDQDEYFIPFEHAHCSDPSDYCLAEYEKYKTLRMHGLECFLAKTIFYRIKDEVRIFLQEIIREINCLDTNRTKQPSVKSSELANSLMGKKRCPFNRKWLAQCIDAYGYEKVLDFLSYCENVDKDVVQDMHGNNYGYRENGAPAILDFSGYFD